MALIAAVTAASAARAVQRSERGGLRAAGLTSTTTTDGRSGTTTVTTSIVPGGAVSTSTAVSIEATTMGTEPASGSTGPTPGVATTDTSSPTPAPPTTTTTAGARVSTTPSVVAPATTTTAPPTYPGAGNIAAPTVSASYPVAGGGVISADATWGEATTLSLSVSCSDGPATSRSGLSPLDVEVDDGGGAATCLVTLTVTSGTWGVPDSVTYQLSVTTRAGS
jgi:hypothetical protein